MVWTGTIKDFFFIFCIFNSERLRRFHRSERNQLIEWPSMITSHSLFIQSSSQTHRDAEPCVELLLNLQEGANNEELARDRVWKMLCQLTHHQWWWGLWGGSALLVVYCEKHEKTLPELTQPILLLLLLPQFLCPQSSLCSFTLVLRAVHFWADHSGQLLIAGLSLTYTLYQGSNDWLNLKLEVKGCSVSDTVDQREATFAPSILKR